MRKFILTSHLFTGSITFGFNSVGWLTYFNNEFDFEDKQHSWLLANLPRHIEQIEAYAGRIKGKLEEVPPDLSFDSFWNAYGKKINRKRAELLYKKMDEPQRLKCILSIKPYLSYLSRVKWRTQADPDTYLRNENYETDWNKQM